jgi:hypothetical protein
MELKYVFSPRSFGFTKITNIPSFHNYHCHLWCAITLTRQHIIISSVSCFGCITIINRLDRYFEV